MATRPHPGQIWRFQGETIVVLGEGDPGVWSVQEFNWFNASPGSAVQSGWLIGRDRLLGTDDFTRAEFVGILPPPAPGGAATQGETA